MKERKHVRTQAAMPIDRDAILAHFRQRRRHGRQEYMDSLVGHLVRMILDQGEFGNFESVIEFCGTPDNLGRWLPTEADRIIFSAGLMQGLREISEC